MSSSKVELSEATLRAIADIVFRRMIERDKPGRKPKCFCGTCRNCKMRVYMARKYEQRRREREARLLAT